MSKKIFEPGPYWKNHLIEIKKYASQYGFENFRNTSNKSINCFTGTDHKFDKNYRKKFWTLHDILKKIPLLRLYLNKYDLEINRLMEKHNNFKNRDARLMHFILSNHFNVNFDKINDKLIGSPFSIELNKKKYSYEYLYSFLRYEHIKKFIDFKKIKVIVELGAGYGSLAEIIVNQNSHIKYIILDFPTITQFADYYLTQSLNQKTIKITKKELKDKINFGNYKENIFIGSNELIEYINDCDLFINEASLQEMTHYQFEIYLKHIESFTNYIYLYTLNSHIRENYFKKNEKLKKYNIQKKVDFSHPGYSYLFYSR